MEGSTPAILFEKKDGVALITLNRPAVLNALNRELGDGLREALIDFRDDPEMRLAILAGAGGRAFCVGMDLKDRTERAAEGELLPETRPSFLDMGIFKPIIAAIDGYCVAAGLELAMQCDIRIATARSEFGLPEPRWSLTSGYGLHNLSRMIPLGEALYMQLTGRRIDATRAYQIGLIQELAPDRDALLATAERITEEVKLCAPLAVRAIKQVVYQGRGLPLEESQKLGAALSSQVHGSQDAIEGPRAFAEKRKPAWKTR